MSDASHPQQSTAVLEPAADAANDDATVDSGSVCSECAGTLTAGGATVCPHCGWYPSLGIYVEVSAEWEAAATVSTIPTTKPTHLEVWTSLVPKWGWVLVATAVTIVLASVAVRVVWPEPGGMRTHWAVAQLIAGLCVAAVCHVVGFVMVSTSEPDLGVADIVVSPFKAWRKLVERLPSCLWIINTGQASVVSAVCAAGIIGAIPYEVLLDWNIDAPPEKSLLGAVMERAGEVGGPEMSMEDAVSQFAGDAAGDRNLDAAPKPKSNNLAAQYLRKNIDALILGYELDSNGGVYRLLLATERKSKLIYSGRVIPVLDEQEMADLKRKLLAYKAPRPIINVPAQANWVQPRLTCRVSYERRVDSGLLTSLMWEKLLSEMKLPW